MDDKNFEFRARSNIVNILLQQQKKSGSSAGKKQCENPNGENGEKQKEVKSGGDRKKEYSEKLTDSDRNMLDKLVGDDQTSQAEYIKKKIKLKERKGQVRW